MTAENLLLRTKDKSHFTVNPVAEQLGLVDAHGPGAVLALAASVVLPSYSTFPLPSTAFTSEYTHNADGSNAVNGASTNGTAWRVNGEADGTYGASNSRPESHFYGYMLNACEKLFEGELDQATFEENMRFLFGTKVRWISVFQPHLLFFIACCDFYFQVFPFELAVGCFAAHCFTILRFWHEVLVGKSD
jgi:hypothetical protein